ncbi:MAG: aminotransferase class IV [Bacteroidetes bacterium]|nr:aminotransferase class IV [Bacteroidota bacterium]
MCRFIETIRLKEGTIQNLEHHQQRVNFTTATFFPKQKPVELKKLLSECPLPTLGLHKIRLTYGRDAHEVKISLYVAKPIQRLKIVYDDVIDYAHKFEDRSQLNQLFLQKGKADEIIIVKNGFVTDASFANLLFKRKDQWVTPHAYLLNGTQRQFLLNQKIIEEETIRIKDFHRYEKVKLINALLEGNGQAIDINQIEQ